MIGLSFMVWLCAIGILISGIVRVMQKKVLLGLLLMVSSVVVWFCSWAIAESVPAGTARPLIRSPAAAADDIDVVKPSWKRMDGQVVWDVTLRNKSHTVAYADIQFRTTYSAPSGTVVTTHHGVIYEVLQPNETREWWQLTDGYINDQATTAGFEITAASPR